MSGVKGRSGRKGSKAQQLSNALSLVDKRMPEIIFALLDKALTPPYDRDALVYLIDRRFGKPSQQTDIAITGGEDISAMFAMNLFKALREERARVELEQPIKAVLLEEGKE